MTVQLRGGARTEDVRLDRVPQFDERSRQYPIRAVVPAVRRSYRWGLDLVLDQGREGACVGYAITHEAAAKPKPVRGLTAADAYAVYSRARELDAWPGENYSGTSVLAGLKAARERGWIIEYRWAFGLDDVTLALGHAGPVVLGIAWYESMYQPRSGWLQIEGAVVGGHAILARGVNFRSRKVLLHNSWGADWGGNGTAWITFENLERLLQEDGEAAVPLVRALRL